MGRGMGRGVTIIFIIFSRIATRYSERKREKERERERERERGKKINIYLLLLDYSFFWLLCKELLLLLLLFGFLCKRLCGFFLGCLIHNWCLCVSNSTTTRKSFENWIRNEDNRRNRNQHHSKRIEREGHTKKMIWKSPKINNNDKNRAENEATRNRSELAIDRW